MSEQIQITSGADLMTSDKEREIALFVQELNEWIRNNWKGRIFSNEKDEIKSLPAKTVSDISFILRNKLKDFSLEKIKIFLHNARFVLEAFLSSKYLISAIDSDGLVHLTAMALESCIQPDYFEDCEIRMGFGAVEQEYPNARVPSYIIAVKHILEEIIQRRKMLAKLSDVLYFPKHLPKVILYSVANLAEQSNRGNQERINSSARRNFDLIRLYLFRFADSDVAEHFCFDNDIPIEPNSILDHQLSFYVRILKLMNEDPIKTAKEKVITMGEKYGSSLDNSLRYASAHSIFSSDPVPGPSLKILHDTNPKFNKVIMLGGTPEKTFYRIRYALEHCPFLLREAHLFFNQRGTDAIHNFDDICNLYKDAMNKDLSSDEYRRVQLISKVGDKSVYGKHPGDWSIDDFAKKSLPDLLSYFDDEKLISLSRDLLALLTDIQGIPISYAYAYNPSKKFDRALIEAFDYGYYAYSQFCGEMRRILN